MTSIAIIGSGISGLLAAYHVFRRSASSSLRVYEARHYIGRPHCTGLVSEETLNRIPFAREYVLREYSSVKILVPELRASVDIVFEDRRFVKIDRVGLERRLYSELSSLGVDFSLGDPVYGALYRGGRWFVRSKSGTREYDLLILASGYNRRLAEALGLSSRAEVLSGLQVELETGSRLPVGEDSVLVVMLRRMDGGFAWVVPLEERKVILGCASDPSELWSGECLRLMLTVVSKIVGGSRALSEPYGGVVLRGYPLRPYNERAFGLGDSVSMVKSLSGGGLYAASIASKLAPAFVERRHGLMRSLESLSSELERHYRTAKSVQAALRLAEAVGFSNVRVTVRARGIGYDDHPRIMLGILKSGKLLRAVTARRSATLRVGTKD